MIYSFYSYNTQMEVSFLARRSLYFKIMTFSKVNFEVNWKKIPFFYYFLNNIHWWWNLENHPYNGVIMKLGEIFCLRKEQCSGKNELIAFVYLSDLFLCSQKLRQGNWLWSLLFVLAVISKHLSSGIWKSKVICFIRAKYTNNTIVYMCRQILFLN